MSFKYQEAVPWGRSYEEYVRMFRLTQYDQRRTILGCADGPASFNAEGSRRSHKVVSCDPLYQLRTAQIHHRIEATYETVIAQTRQNLEKFLWNEIRSPEELGRLRRAAMNDFLSDYDRGREEGRYIAAQLPDLPFAPKRFDLALCSHFLFFYSDSLSLAFHKRSVDELCRVAQEVRIFPLLTYNAEPSPLLPPILEHLEKQGHVVSQKGVPYEFQRNGNTMMRIVTAR